MYKLALAGIAVPIIILITVVTAGFLEPGYSRISQLTSELATPEARFGWVINLLLFFLTGPLMIAFALGMYWGVENSTKVGTGLLIIVGLTLIGMGLFPCDPGCTPPPRTFSGHLHWGRDLWQRLIFGVLFLWVGVLVVSLDCLD